MTGMVFTNGLIVDGTGQPGKKGDVAICGDRIVSVGGSHQRGDKKIIDAEGMVVAPGFIDVHSHSDFTLLANPGADGKVCQGVTTEICGNCGTSGGPLRGAVRERRKDELRGLGLSITWSSLGEYLSLLEQALPAVNVATLVGHGNLRGAVVGYDNRLPTREELNVMESLLAESLDAGALGISTGLIYPPGVYSSPEELVTLGRSVAESGGLYTTHLRSEGDRLVEAVEEAIAIAEKSGVSLQLSHLKTNGRRNWAKLSAVFQLIEQATTSGVNLHADRYPYTASFTDLDVLLPPWVWEGGRASALRRITDSACQQEITAEILAREPEPGFWKTVVVSSVFHERNKSLEGRSLEDIAGDKGRHPWEILYELLIEEELMVNALFFSMNEENLQAILARDYVMIGTDSAARSLSMGTGGGKPHPRGFGTYPRILRQWTGEGKLLPLEKAIHKMTGLPAKKFGLPLRGFLKEGYYADLVVFNPQTVQDHADYDNPYQRPTGIEHVIINGSEVISGGEATGKRPGKVIKRKN